MKHKTCHRCHRELDSEEAITFRDVFLCEDCFDEETAVCDRCGERVWVDDTESDSGILVCRQCYNSHYTRCEDCDRLLLTRDVHYLDDFDGDPYCFDCYTERMRNKKIHPYIYKPEPVFYGSGTRYFGVELEIDHGGESDDNAKKLLSIANRSNTYLYAKHDGSLDEGFELVSHPATLDYHLNSIPWGKVMFEAAKMGYRSHKTQTCGLHIHVNRESFGQKKCKQDACIARILFFLENHWSETLKFSRRTSEQMNRWAARYGRKSSPKELLDSAKERERRYTCVNLTNEDTIEFRMFRGTLRWNTFVAALQFVDMLCDLACHLSDENMECLSWHEFVPKEDYYPELIQYLKERELYINEPVLAEGEI